MTHSLNITTQLASQLIADQFPEYTHLPIVSVKKQGHDNRTFQLGNDLLIRMPTEEVYALKVPKEQEILPRIGPYLSVSIPKSIKMGKPSPAYPFNFSIYQWIEGTSVNQLKMDDKILEILALQLATFLKELQKITQVEGPPPGQHNWWRGDHVSVYDAGAREQINKLSHMIAVNKAMNLWEQACQTKWKKPAVWIHGDIASGNILIQNNNLSGVIDFGGTGMGDPACDLVIAWTLFKDKSREIFINAMNLDNDTWLRAKAWALWKATYELCQIQDKNSHESVIQQEIIHEILK